jgi:hypothetical protein
MEDTCLKNKPAHGTSQDSDELGGHRSNNQDMCLIRRLLNEGIGSDASKIALNQHNENNRKDSVK